MTVTAGPPTLTVSMASGGPTTSTGLRVRDRSGGRLRVEIARRSGSYDLGERDVRVFAEINDVQKLDRDRILAAVDAAS